MFFSLFYRATTCPDCFKPTKNKAVLLFNRWHERYCFTFAILVILNPVSSVHLHQDGGGQGFGQDLRWELQKVRSWTHEPGLGFESWLFEYMLFIICRHYPCPPKKASSKCKALDTTCLHTSVFVAGNKCTVLFVPCPCVRINEITTGLSVGVQVGIISFLGSFLRRRGWSTERDGWTDLWRNSLLLRCCRHSEPTVCDDAILKCLISSRRLFK